MAAATVWAAGPGRPGLLEPMGVHREHRGFGYGRAITVAAAAALRELGSSSAIVCAADSNVGAVVTYSSLTCDTYTDARRRDPPRELSQRQARPAVDRPRVAFA